MGRKEIEKAVETLLEPCLEKEGIELVSQHQKEMSEVKGTDRTGAT